MYLEGIGTIPRNVAKKKDFPHFPKYKLDDCICSGTKPNKRDLQALFS